MFQGAFKTLLLLILLPLFLPGAQAQFLVDQSNTYTWTPEAGARSIQILGPIGQGFKPTFSSLDVVELYTKDFDGAGSPGNGLGADLFARIRIGTISGPVIATSETLSLPDQFRGVSRFHFTSPVALVPGNTYVMEPWVVAGDNWGVISTDPWPLDDGYPHGNAYVLGQPSSDDMWFREGVAVPEPRSAALLMCIGLSGAGLVCRRHLRQSL